MAHGDYTGNTKVELAARFAKQEQLRATESDLIRQTVREAKSNTVIDLFTDADETPPSTPQYVQAESGEVEIQLVPLQDPRNQATKFQASETLDEVTVGRDRTFNLESGQVYRAPKWVVEHLDEKHLVRH